MVSLPWIHQLQLGENHTFRKVSTSAVTMQGVEKGSEEQGQVRQKVCPFNSLTRYLGMTLQSFIEYLQCLDTKNAAMNKLNKITPIL